MKNELREIEERAERWKDAPDWAGWLAVDSDGEAYWYEDRPRFENEVGRWTAFHAELCMFGSRSYCCHLDADSGLECTIQPRPTESEIALLRIIAEMEAGMRGLVGKKYATSGYFRRKIKSLLEQVARDE